MSEANEWVESLPEGVRDWNEVKEAESADKFWEVVSNMRSRMGRSITIPGEDAGDEDRKLFLTKLQDKVPDLMPRPTPEDPESLATTFKMLGTPDDADGYKTPEFETDEGVNVNTDKIESFKAIAHEANLTTKQFEHVVKKFTEAELAEATANHGQFVEGLKTLKAEWGAKADENLQLSEAIRKQYFPFLPEQLDANTIKSFVSIATQLGTESKELLGQTASGVLTPQEASLQLSEIYRNTEHPYWNSKDPAHKAARARVTKLTRMSLGASE